MTQKYHHHTYRAALSIAAVATVFFTSHASAQMLGQNIFGGTNTPGPTSISTTSAVITITPPVTGPIGPGFSGTVSLPVGVVDTLTETLNVGGNATLTAGESGIAGALGSFSATKALTPMFVPTQAYSFTLVTTNNAALSLLSGFNVAFTTNGTTPQTIYSASGGTGLLGAAQLLNLFGSGNTATFNFTAPAGVDTSVPITVTISGQLAASALGSTFSFTSGTLDAVPEPGTVGATGVGIAGLALLRFRRRSARN